jgi:insulysin
MARAVPWIETGAATVDADGGVWKSQSDDRSYRALQLANGLRCLLISDAAADTGAAAMSVAVGHTSDPSDIAGLSHFLEHMLFLGTSKYPDEASYKRFLKDKGGASNASTSAEATTYFFSVRHEHLEEAVDRFSSFFCGPLMTPSATEREVNAVDSENSKNLQVDERRFLQLRKALCRRDHVWAKFGTGSKQTLAVATAQRGVDLRQALLSHYATFYSASIMTFAVLGRQSLDELQVSPPLIFQILPACL